VDQTGACWVWVGARDRDGYGVTQVDRVWLYAHRRAWELTHGPIPAVQWVLHRCDNRACVNPAHLWLGDNTVNSHDRDAKGRWAGGSPPGAYGPRLTAAQLDAYARNYFAHVLPPRMLAVALGVNGRYAAAISRHALAKR
jgi:hypothetical protein